MRNPWQDLSQAPPYLLVEDRKAILAHNQKVPDELKIQHHVQPEPYLGKPDAPIILLGLNPGYADDNIAFYQDEYVRKIWQKNILHDSMDYPFFFLDPNLDPTIGGAKWWRQKLRSLIEMAGLKNVANRLCCIEYFPYHSVKYKPLREITASQKYSFHLLRQAIHNQATIVLMRSERLWLSAIPELVNYKHLYRLNSSQNIAVSRRNCPEGFPVLERLVSQ